MGLVKQFAMPRLGAMAKQFEKPWKICGMGWTLWGPMTCLCHNENRKQSKVLLWDQVIHDDTKPESQSSNETIGNTYVEGEYVGFVGENGRVWVYDGRHMMPWFTTRFANAMTKHNGKVIMFDTDKGKISIRLCHDASSMTPAGTEIGTMPGSGIVMAACSFGGNIYAAVADSKGGEGLARNDNILLSLPGCLCVVPFADDLVYTSQNRVLTRRKGVVATLDCEKIMDAKVVGNHVYLAGANPDSLWIGNARGEIALVGRVKRGNKEVGGSCFRVRVMVDPHETEGYFGRTADGDQGEVFEILW